MIKAKDIHVIQKNDRYVAFHPESLSLFAVTEDIGKLLKFYEMNSKCLNSEEKENINSILNYFSELIELDSAKDFKWINLEPRALSLLVSQDCNLRCGYCYADHGIYGSEEKKLMSYDTAKKCIDKLLSKDNSNHISFFGGEPLLNFTLIKRIDSYVNKKNLNVVYTMTTNGTIMNDEIKNFINEKFLNLRISLDGPKDINDGQRFGGVKSVHDRVIETIGMLHPRSYPITIKSIVTKKSANRLTEIVEHISSLNIDSIDIKPVIYVPPGSKFFINDEDYKTYINELANIHVSNIIKLANGEKVKPISDTCFILALMITKTRWIYRCAAGRGLITITADGDVYPCEKYIGLSDFHMGNVHDDDFPGERFRRLRDMFYAVNIYNSPDCNACWARFLCGGVCHWQSYITHEEMSRPTERRCMETKAILEALLPEIAEIFSDEVKTKNVLKYLKLDEQNEVVTALSH